MKAKIKKLIAKRPKIKLRFRRKNQEQSMTQAIKTLPRITNETVAEHREEILSTARKFIYPLKHSAHRVVIISAALGTVGLIVFFMYCFLALYRFNTTSTFVYRVTQVIPFPVAKAGPHVISYESYLFELRHYMHYYETQQKVDFSSTAGKQQLEEFRKRALQIVIDNAYIKQLAKEKSISVSDRELEDAITLVRNQNRLGSSDQVFADVLKEFWGWSVGDFKRELRQQLLTQKVTATMDADAQKRARDAYDQIQKGADFAATAKQYSDDAGTRDAGGDYGFSIDKSDRDLAPQVIDALFKLKPSETSGIVDTGTGLEILRVKEMDGTKVRAAHITINFKPISTYLDPIRAKQKQSVFTHR